jgi:hypothetical protein
MKPRTDCSYSAVIRSLNPHSNKVKACGQVLNLSASGMFLWVDRIFDQGEKISVTVEFPIGSLNGGNPKLVAQTVVVRSGGNPSMGYGIAVKINDYRFH